MKLKTLFDKCPYTFNNWSSHAKLSFNLDDLSKKDRSAIHHDWEDSQIKNPLNRSIDNPSRKRALKRK